MLGPSRSALFSFSRSVACLAFVGTIAIMSSSACSSDLITCDPTQCAEGNKCVPYRGVTKCRKLCTSNVVAAESCPFGYTCTDPLTGGAPFCVESTARVGITPLTQKSGQWGQGCQANLGFENPACDTGQGFFCYAQSPTDANAYCTRYDCAKDTDCGPGFYCGHINSTPNINTGKKVYVGDVQAVCLKRSYCSPCQVDLDCLPFNNLPQHCVVDLNGASYCMPECADSKNCPNEARCVDAGVGANVCYPRASVCIGDGSLCSPCLVDTDCGEDGACVKGQYTTERMCAKKAPNGDCTQCPKSITSPKRSIGCSTEGTASLPKGYCVGTYSLGGTDGADLGCWTLNR